MSEWIPLFPLSTVLFPGLVLPLHVFEPRYRQLVVDLLETPEPQLLGVIAIRKGRETGIDGVEALYGVGCTALVQQVESLPDGRSNLLTIGAQRFRLHALDDSRPYLQGEVDLLQEPSGDPDACAVAVSNVQAAFRDYFRLLAERTGASAELPELPDDPLVLSYVVAVSMVIDLVDKQSLLETPDSLSRLEAEHRLLTHEMTMLRTLTAAPAPYLARAPYNPN